MISKICLDAYLLKELGGLGKFDVLNSVLELDDLIKFLASEAWKVVCFCITPWKDYEKEDEEFVKGIKYYIKKVSEILEDTLKQLCEGKYKDACARIKNKVAYICRFFRNQYISMKRCRIAKGDDHCNKCVSDLLNPNKLDAIVPNNVLREHPWTISCIAAAFCNCIDCLYIVLGEHSYQHFKRVCEEVDVRKSRIRIAACILH